MARPSGHPDNKLISTLGNHVRWSGVSDRSAETAPARAGFRDRFIREARERFGNLPDPELARRADSLRKAHMARLALRSAQARRARKGGAA